MSYLEIYKKRMGGVKLQAHDKRDAMAKHLADRNFTLAEGYFPAILKENGKELTEIDVAIRSGTSELQKYIFFRPNSKIKIGSYITYNEKTYIVKEVNIDGIVPKGDCYYCNQAINFLGLDEPIPCYSNSTTYGSKGILDQGKFYELDSKTKVFIQRNKYTETLKIGYRIMFANEYIYKITEIDDMVFKGMYTIVCQRDEVTPMDDFENNIAYNEFQTPVETPTVPDLPDVVEDIHIIGESKLKIGTEQVYSLSQSLENCVWVVDDVSYAHMIEMQENSVTIVGLKTGWVTLSVKQGDRVLSEMDILISR